MMAGSAANVNTGEGAEDVPVGGNSLLVGAAPQAASPSTTTEDSAAAAENDAGTKPAAAADTITRSTAPTTAAAAPPPPPVAAIAKPPPPPRRKSPPPYMATYVHPDDIAAFQLRTTLSTDIPFMQLWHVMEAQNWRHRGGRYYTPRGVGVGTSIECFAVLDRYGGIPPRRSVGRGTAAAAATGSAFTCAGGVDEEEARTMRKLRDDLLEGYLRHQQFRANERQQKKRKRKLEAAAAAAVVDQQAAGNSNGTQSTGDVKDEDDGTATKFDDGSCSLGSALFSIGGGMSDASPARTPGSVQSGDDGDDAGSSTDTDGGADLVQEQIGGSQWNTTATTTGARKKRTSARSMGGGDRGAEAYLQNKVTAPAAKRFTRQSLEVYDRFRPADREVNTGNPITAEKSAKEGGGANADADPDGEPEYHVWPNLERNVSTVRDYAVEISEAGVQALDEDYVPSFDEWRFLLSTNHSVLLYGFGSKRSLLNDFAENILPHDGEVLTLDGYDRTININDILTALVQLYLGGQEPRPRSLVSRSGDRATSIGLGIVPPTQSSPAVVRRALAIGERLAFTRSFPIYLVLHNIDGVGLRYRQTQDALATLVASSVTSDGTRMIRLVSSVDHVNASATLWSTQTRSAFGWIWKEVHTYRPSFEEVRLGGEEGPVRKTRYGTGVGVGHRASTSGGGDGMGFMRVLESIGTRHAEALKLLAREQYKLMKEQERKSQQGTAGRRGRSKPAQPTISYNAWKKMCMGKMCASDDTGLRNMLTELTDHGIIAAKNLDDGRHLFIPHPLPVLKQILQFDPNAD